jgi:hypothetical protein
MEFSAQAPFARFAPRLQERSPSATITFTQHLSRKGEPCGRHSQGFGVDVGVAA